MPRQWYLPGLTAGALAGLVSGAPSTLHALLTGRDPLAAARAAGNLVLPAEAPPAQLLLAGAGVHTVVSLGWGTVLGVALSRLPPSPAGPGLGVSPWTGAAWGALAGLGIAAFDLAVVGRRRPLIRDLPLLPQVTDHLAFGAVAGAVVARWGRG
jgi:hypothetical protein